LGCMSVQPTYLRIRALLLSALNQRHTATLTPARPSRPGGLGTSA
jgi:hypothetical protein